MNLQVATLDVLTPISCEIDVLFWINFQDNRQISDLLKFHEEINQKVEFYALKPTN